MLIPGHPVLLQEPPEQAPRDAQHADEQDLPPTELGTPNPQPLTFGKLVCPMTCVNLMGGI